MISNCKFLNNNYNNFTSKMSFVLDKTISDKVATASKSLSNF